VSELTLQSLQQTYDYLRSLPPVVCEIWFVDQPRAYAALRGALRARPDGSDLFGIRVFEWYARYAKTDEDWARAPAFCRTPGVWVRYTDGTEQELLMSKTETLYLCPDCGRESTDPQVRKATPAGSTAGTEYHCPCGKVYTRLTARTATFRDRT
jgi:predicted RNA-binding Zn-ribbon protein involved in translation (DUF1610 family)